MFARVKGKKVKVKNGTLYLSSMQINDFTQIEGLEELKNLKNLLLFNNKN